jgi:hypothetical protein
MWRARLHGEGTPSDQAGSLNRNKKFEPPNVPRFTRNDAYLAGASGILIESNDMESVVLTRITILFSALTLCASARAQPPPQQSFIDCIRFVASDPEYQDISSKLPLKDIAAISFSMLADQTRPTPKQREEIAAYFDERDRCWVNSSERAHFRPELLQLTEESASGLKSIGVDLYNRKVTFGQANKLIADLRDSLIARGNVILAQYKAADDAQEAAANAAAEREALGREQQRQASARLAAQQEANASAEAYREQMLRQQRAQAFMNLMQATRPPPAPSPPQTTTTNCNAYGTSMTCYSH